MAQFSPGKVIADKIVSRKFSHPLLPFCRMSQACFAAASLTAATAITATTNNCCARHPQRSGFLNGIVATADCIGKLTGPLIGAPVLAFAISARPAAEHPSGAALVFAGFGGLIGVLALIGCWLPKSAGDTARVSGPLQQKVASVETLDEPVSPYVVRKSLELHPVTENVHVGKRRRHSLL